jgi:hypothetical protein
VTATLSVEGAQARAICELDDEVAVRLAGALGGVLSSPHPYWRKQYSSNRSVSNRVHGADAKAVRAAGKQAAIVKTGHRGDEHLRKGGAQIPDTAFNTVAGYPDIVRGSRPTEIDLRRGNNACRKSGGSRWGSGVGWVLVRRRTR